VENPGPPKFREVGIYFWNWIYLFWEWVANKDTVVGVTTTALEDITDAVNVGKHEGKQEWNTTTGRPVWASGDAVGDVWVFADGTTAHTPV